MSLAAHPAPRCCGIVNWFYNIYAEYTDSVNLKYLCKMPSFMFVVHVASDMICCGRKALQLQLFYQIP